MRIALVADGDPEAATTWSGTPRNVLKALAAEGVDVFPVDAFAAVQPRVRVAARALWEAQVRARRPVVSGRPPRSVTRYDFQRAPFARRSAALAVEAALRGIPLDGVLHMGQLTLSGDARPRTPQLVYADTTWNLTGPSWVAAHRLDSGLSKRLDREEARALRAVRHVFTVSEHVRNDAVQHYGLPAERVEAVGTGLGNTVAYHGPKDYRAKHLLFVAKVRFEEKGGPLLLEAFRQAHAVDPELRLTLVGQDCYRQYDGLPGVSAPGAVGLDTLQTYFQQASLFVMPASYEPWGMVYLQALAARTPIVGLRAHAFPELVQHGAHGFIVEKHDATALATTLLEAVRQPALLEHMGAAGQTWVLRRFGWDKVARAVVRALE